MLDIKTLALITGLGCAAAGGATYYFHTTVVTVDEVDNTRINALRDQSSAARQKIINEKVSSPTHGFLERN